MSWEERGGVGIIGARTTGRQENRITGTEHIGIVSESPEHVGVEGDNLFYC